MEYELELNRTNRLKLAAAFRQNQAADYPIDCVLEGQMGKAYVDNLAYPLAYCVQVGPYSYFAGEADSAGGYLMLEGLPADRLFMLSSLDWLDIAQEVYGQSLRLCTHYRFSPAGLSAQHLESLLAKSPYRDQLVPLFVDLAAYLAYLPESNLELSDFDSIQDFVDRGLGFAILEEGKLIGVAYSSLVCSRGIEVRVFVAEPHRRQGVGTALGARLLLECLRRGLNPHWDAATPESCKLAQKLGFQFAEAYEAYYHTGEAA